MVAKWQLKRGHSENTLMPVPDQKFAWKKAAVSSKNARSQRSLLFDDDQQDLEPQILRCPEDMVNNGDTAAFAVHVSSR